MKFIEYVYLIISLTCFVSFGYTLTGIFRQPQQNRALAGISTLAIGSAITWLSAIYLIIHREFYNLESVYIGVAIQILCLVLFWRTASIAKMKLNVIFSKDAPYCVLEQGPYKFIRHPFYTAYLLSYWGIFISYPHAISLFTAIGMLMIYIFAALKEEKKFTQSSLASQYVAYKRRTGMFFPKLL